MKTLIHVWIILVVLVLTACNKTEEPDPTPQINENDPFTVIASGLNRPWGITFIDNNSFLITERNGNLLYFDGDNLNPLSHGLNVRQQGQGGLLDIALSPDYDQTNFVYMTYSKWGQNDKSTLALVRFRWDGSTLSGMEELFEALPYYENPAHYGSRIAFDQNGHVFITLGDRNAYSTASRIPDVFQAFPQTLDNHWGKVVRLNLDGSIPSDNPFVGQSAALPEIYTYGHRNPQGIAYKSDTDQIFVNEHGAQGGDEINVLASGNNYGWPVITYGKDYNDRTIGEGTERSGMEQPVIYWDPSVAPSSMMYYTGSKHPDWQNRFFMTTLANETLFRLSGDANDIQTEEEMLRNRLGRLRAVTASPDGNIYLLIDSDNGRVIRLNE